MIELQFSNESAQERRDTLALHVHADVTVQRASGGGQLGGKLVQVTQRALRLALANGDHTNIPLNDVRVAWVHTGGDWVTAKGHGAGAMTDRIHVRCSPQEKQQLAALAQNQGISLSELMRQTALRALKGMAS